MSRAQSETLGFVFVFALITLTVGSVFALGTPGLEAVQDAERTANMERAFEVLDDNVEDLVRDGAPSRATEIKLAGGSLAIAGETTVRINVTDTANASHNDTFSMTARRISYSDGDGTTVSYAEGAVLRSDGDAAVMLSEPDWLVGDRRAVVPLVVTFRDSNRSSLGGRTTVLVRTERKSGGLAGTFETGGAGQAEVNVTVESTNAEAWGRFFESRGMTALDADGSDGAVTYQFTTDALYVPRASIATTLSG